MTIFNDHSNLAGRHAFLSASVYHWINYTDEKLVDRYHTHLAAKRGTELHEFAHHAITLGIKLPRTQQSLNMYVNDAIGFRMSSEQILYYSMNSFGTADTISFRKNLLRIHDLKSGVTPASMKQLEVYAALFCLEYKQLPSKIGMELRIYQNDEVRKHEPSVHDITHIMDRIVTFDKYIERMKAEAQS